MTSFKLLAPAKINLYLAVLGRRTDGYHNLCTLFQRIDLCDEISVKIVKRKPKTLLRVSGYKVSARKDNLVYRAYELLRQDFPRIPYLKIFLKKRIPVAAGLGGGSSDAGTFLFGANLKLGLGLTRQKLCVLASRLGADVPFFVSKFQTALGTGKGDLLLRKQFIGKYWIVLVTFSKGLSTKEIYKGYDRLSNRASSLTNAKHDVNILSKYLLQKDLSQVAPRLRNDLKGVSEGLKPAIQRVLSFLAENGIEAASLSGSGPTCFAILHSKKSAERLRRKIHKRFRLRTYLCQSF